MFKIKKGDQPVVNVFEGVVRQTLACGKDLLISRFAYKKDAKVPPHKHAFEQVTTILEGRQKVIIHTEKGSEEILVKAGDSYIVPAHFKHEQHSLTEAITIDAWCLAP
jgi:quercetin dioxygenase-like cupin family protein